MSIEEFKEMIENTRSFGWDIARHMGKQPPNAKKFNDNFLKKLEEYDEALRAVHGLGFEIVNIKESIGDANKSDFFFSITYFNNNTLKQDFFSSINDLCNSINTDLLGLEAAFSDTDYVLLDNAIITKIYLKKK